MSLKSVALITLLASLSVAGAENALSIGAVPTDFTKVRGVGNTAVPDGKPHSFSFGGTNHSEFHLDGKPFQIRSAEIHLQRISAEY